MKTKLNLNIEVELDFKFDEASQSVRIEWLRFFGELMMPHKIGLAQLLDFEKQILAEIKNQKNAESVLNEPL